MVALSPVRLPSLCRPPRQPVLLSQDWMFDISRPSAAEREAAEAEEAAAAAAAASGTQEQEQRRQRVSFSGGVLPSSFLGGAP